MTRLFVELYLDEDVDVLVVELIRRQGFTVTTAQEAGQLLHLIVVDVPEALKPSDPLTIRTEEGGAGALPQAANGAGTTLEVAKKQGRRWLGC